jgi:hypothetical protein
LYGSWGERRIPEPRCKAELYELLRKELGLPATASRGDVFEALTGRSWDAEQQRWLVDSEAGHATQP